jgi:hypothetical protein
MDQHFAYGFMPPYAITPLFNTNFIIKIAKIERFDHFLSVKIFTNQDFVIQVPKCYIYSYEIFYI